MSAVVSGWLVIGCVFGALRGYWFVIDQIGRRFVCCATHSRTSAGQETGGAQ